MKRVMGPAGMPSVFACLLAIVLAGGLSRESANALPRDADTAAAARIVVDGDLDVQTRVFSAKATAAVLSRPLALDAHVEVKTLGISMELAHDARGAAARFDLDAKWWARGACGVASKLLGALR